MKLNHLFKQLNLDVSYVEKVHGGDINETYCLHTTEAKFFLKINMAKQYPDMFLKEAKGLDTLREHTLLPIPKVFDQGIINNWQYLLLEWIEKGTPTTDTQFKLGAGIAKMHQASRDYFGFEEDNYIGSLIQTNSPKKDWATFYTDCRILPLVKLLRDENALSKNDAEQAEKYCTSLNGIFPDEPPSLLHGDLWHGNYIIANNGHANLVDPAVYFGHREMDIGMTLFFGGFSPDFYSGYNEIFPLERNWEKRIPYTQLYPLLVHAVLFGGHYVHNVRDTVSRF